MAADGTTPEPEAAPGKAIQWVPAAASLLFPGAGQLVQGRVARALLLLLLAAALWWSLELGYLVHLWAAFDAALARRP